MGGEKRRAELSSKGVKISLSNESEGTKVKLVREAEGEALSVELRAQAQAEAIRKVSAELQKPGGMDAAKLALAREYVLMYGEMGKQSNTMLFNDRPADINALLSQAALALSTGANQANNFKGQGTIDVDTSKDEGKSQ